jgi:DNA-binding beta-propeller fold protein YncE
MRKSSRAKTEFLPPYDSKHSLLGICLFFTATLCPAQTAGDVWGAPNGSTDSLQTFDPTTGAILSQATIAGQYSYVFAAKDGVTLLAPHNNRITLFSGLTGQVTATVIMPDIPGEVVFSPDGRTAYVAGSHSIMVLGLTTLTVTQQHRVPGSVGALALSPDGARIYAPSKAPNQVKPADVPLPASTSQVFASSIRPHSNCWRRPRSFTDRLW